MRPSFRQPAIARRGTRAPLSTAGVARDSAASRAGARGAVASPGRYSVDMGGRRALVVTPLVKPRLRGVFHQFAFFVSLAAGGVLVAAASSGRARLAAGVYPVAVSALFRT